MMKMKQVRVCHASTDKRIRPHPNQPLVRIVIDRGEDTVRRARPILVRRLERHSALASLPAGRIVDRDQIDATKEGRCMRLLTRPSQRASHQRHLPARRR
jgi:hypothetical protein